MTWAVSKSHPLKRGAAQPPPPSPRGLEGRRVPISPSYPTDKGKAPAMVEGATGEEAPDPDDPAEQSHSLILNSPGVSRQWPERKTDSYAILGSLWQPFSLCSNMAGIPNVAGHGSSRNVYTLRLYTLKTNLTVSSQAHILSPSTNTLSSSFISLVVPSFTGRIRWHNHFGNPATWKPAKSLLAIHLKKKPYFTYAPRDIY